MNKLISLIQRANWKSIKRTILLFIYREKNIPRDLISDNEWDYLFVIDACRYDYFAKYNFIPGKLEKFTSVGSCTSEWIKKTFSEGDWSDVIYISGTPQVSSYMLKKYIGKNPFYSIDDVWKYNWSEDLNTVHPASLNDALLKSIKLHPNKRHIVHYIQPHQPFIGEKRLNEKINSYKSRGRLLGKNNDDGSDLWSLELNGQIDINDVVEAYISNLKLVLLYIQLYFVSK